MEVGQDEAGTCGESEMEGEGSSKSGRPHLVQNLSIYQYLLDHGENHDSKKYKYTL